MSAVLKPSACLKLCAEDTHEMIVNLMDVIQSLNLKNMQECYNDAIYYRDEIRQLFKHGNISLRERAMGENIFWHVIQKITAGYQKAEKYPQRAGRHRKRPGGYLLRQFQRVSVPSGFLGHWITCFPIMPVHRLNETPTRNAILADITCDCDGKIDKFIDHHDVRKYPAAA